MRKAALFTAVFSLAATLSAADPALLNLVMPDATVLAGVNVQRAKTSPFGQFVLQQIPPGTELEQFVAATGFDPRQDVTEILVASTGQTQPKTGLVLLRGVFDVTKIEAAAAKDGKHAIQTYSGAQLLTATGAKDNGAIAFLPQGIALAGDLASVKAALDRRNGANSVDPVLAAKVASYIAADAWSVSIAPMNFGKPGDAAANPFGGALKSIEQASGSVTFSSPVVIAAEAVAKTDEDATSLSDVIKFLTSMIGGQNAALGGILKTVQVSTDHTIIKVTASIPEADLEQLVKGAAQMKPVGIHRPGAHV